MAAGSVLVGDCVLKDNILYYYCNDINALCSIQIDNGFNKVLTYIEGERLFQETVVASIHLIDDSLVIIPKRAIKNSIYFYELSKGDVKEVFLGDCNVKPPYEKYCGSHLTDNKLILVGCYIPEIVVYDILSKKIKHINIGETGFVFNCSGVVINHILYVPSAQKNAILKFDLSSYKYEWIEILDSKGSYSGIAYDGNYMWILPMSETEIVRWDGKDDFKIYKINCIENINYDGGIICENKLLITSTKVYKKCITVDLKDPNIQQIEEESYVKIKILSDGSVLKMTWEGKNSLYKINGENCTIEMPNTLHIIKELLTQIDSETKRKMLQGVSLENSNIDYKTFINTIKEL